jgi:hypothetical protein
VQLREEFSDTLPDGPRAKSLEPTADMMEQRRVELLEWIRHLASDERVCRARAFHDFLRRDANVRAGRAKKGARTGRGRGAD